MMRQSRFLTLLLTAVFAATALSACGKDDKAKKTAKKRPKVKRKGKKKKKKTAKKGDKKDDKKAPGDKKGDKKAAARAEAGADDKVAKNAAPAEEGAEGKVAEAKPEDNPAPAAAKEGQPAEAAVAGGAPAAAAPEAEPTPEEALAKAEELAKAEAEANKPPSEEAPAPTPGEEVPAAAAPANAPAAPANAAAPAAEPPTPPATGVMPKGAPKLAPTPHVIDKPVKRPDPPLDVTGYISAADLERVLGKKQKFRRSDLPGVKPTKAYNALYYESTKKGLFGVSVQVWRDLSLVDSRTRFNAMRNTYNDVVPTDKVAEQGFRAHFAGVVTLVFADARKPVVAAVSCSVKLCSPDAIIELSRRVSERLR